MVYSFPAREDLWDEYRAPGGRDPQDGRLLSCDSRSSTPIIRALVDMKPAP